MRMRRAAATAAVALFALASPDGPAAAAAQEPPPADSGAATAVSVDSAARLRAALERPPGRPGFDAFDAAALPFQVATFPLFLLVKGGGELAALSAGPGPTAFYVQAYRDVVDWGVVPGVGSLGPRSGPALTLDFVRWRPFFLETGYSLRESQRYRAGLRFGEEEEAPSFEAAFGFQRDAEPHFWGLGPGTAEDASADFLHDQVSVDLRGRVPLVPGVRLVARGGWEDNRVDRGFDGSEPDLQDQFDTATLFGADERTEFLRTGATAEVDLTSRKLFRRRGVRLEAGATQFFGIEGTDADFHRFRGHAEGFLPLNDIQTLKVFGGVESNDGDSGRGVPFTHTAVLGDDLGGRAYDDQRFRANEKAYFGAEWSFMGWRELRDRSQFGGFIFFEEGTVKPDLGEISSSDWRPSWGGGVRLGGRDGVALEGFVAAGEDGVRVQLEAGTSF